MEKDKQSRLVFSFFLTVLSIIGISFIGMFVPFFGGVFGFLIPIPLFYFFFETKEIGSFVSLLISSFIVYLITHSFEYAYLILSFGIPVLIMAHCMFKDIKLAKTLLYPFVIGIFFLTAGIFLVLSFQKSSYEIFVTKLIDKSVNEYKLIFENLLNYSYESANIKKFIKDTFPALAVSSVIVSTFINFIIGKLVFKKKGLSCSENFELLKISEHVIWIFILSLFLIFIKKVGILYLTGLNISLILLFVYFFQGLSIVNYFFIARKIPLFLRITGFFIIGIEAVAAIAVTLLGIFDFWFDFRKSIKLDINTTA